MPESLTARVHGACVYIRQVTSSPVICAEKVVTCAEIEVTGIDSSSKTYHGDYSTSGN